MRHLLKISEFAQFAGLTRKTLIYYDEIGLLKPEKILDNGYRYYSYRQLESVSVIEALKEIGMPLCEIKQHVNSRTPETLIELFTLHKSKVEEKILRLKKTQVMIDTRLNMTRKALEIDPQSIALQECDSEPLFVSEESFYTNDEELENVLKKFYDVCEEKNIIYGSPFGTIISKQNILNRKWQNANRFFFKFGKEDSKLSNMNKPAGLYLVGYETTDYGEPNKIYTRMFDYIDKHNIVISGNSYEEYLLDEIAIKDPSEYLLQISIKVDKI